MRSASGFLDGSLQRDHAPHPPLHRRLTPHPARHEVGQRILLIGGPPRGSLCNMCKKGFELARASNRGTVHIGQRPREVQLPHRSTCTAFGPPPATPSHDDSISRALHLTAVISESSNAPPPSPSTTRSFYRSEPSIVTRCLRGRIS